jgi:hypothetical protein
LRLLPHRTAAGAISVIPLPQNRSRIIIVLVIWRIRRAVVLDEGIQGVGWGCCPHPLSPSTSKINPQDRVRVQGVSLSGRQGDGELLGLVALIPRPDVALPFREGRDLLGR